MSRLFRVPTCSLFAALILAAPSFAFAFEEPPVPLAPGVRGLATRAPGKVAIDGKLNEWSEAFCTPVHYGHRLLTERAAQFHAMWDDEAFYIGLRALDTKQANPGKPGDLWNGDSVEFYLDTRGGAELRGKDWTDGAIHFFFTPFTDGLVSPRWAMRRGIATSDTLLKGVEMGARATKSGYEMEFKIPWSNFPRFQAKEGALLAIDAELCSGDGARRVDRTFAYGSPLSVQQPASQGKIQLVKRFDPDYIAPLGPATFPMWVDTAWVQPERAKVEAVVAIPPVFQDVVGAIEVRIHDADGKIVKTIPAPASSFGPEGWGFSRAVASWSIDDFAPGSYFATAKIHARTGKPLTVVAPRMVSEANITGR